MPDPDPRPSGRAEVIGRGVAWSARWTLRWLVLVAGAILIGLVIQQLWSVLLPVLLALVLATVLAPLSRLLEHRLRVPRALAALTAVLAAVAVVVLTGFLVAPAVVSELANVAESASGGLAELERWVVGSSRFDVTQSQVQAVVEAAQDRLRSSASGIASGVLVGVNAITGALVNLVLALVLCFLFLKDGHRFVPWLSRVAGQRVGGHLGEVACRAWDTLGGFIRTQAMVGLIDAVLIGAGLLIVGVPLVVPLAILTFVAAFAPIVGAITVGALAVLVALVSNGWVDALIILGVVLLVQQLEGNVLLPWLQGRNLRLHSAIVLLSVVLGSTLFGVVGAFLAVPVVAVAADVLRYLDELVLARTGEDRPAAAEEGGG